MHSSPPVHPTPSSSRSPLATRLRALAQEGVYFGTSSWKYQGWLNSIYTPERYLTRGRFSKKKFNAECLSEYAETFPATCGDLTYYQFPSEIYWENLFDQVPPHFQFAFKVPEEITVKSWPTHARYGIRGGTENESFLNSALFNRLFLERLEPYADHVGTVIFEFSTFPKRHYADAAAFVSDLEPFLAALPRTWRYAVEIRNKEFLATPYFNCLRSFNVAHVFNAWTHMPELPEQIAHAEAYTADFLVSRALLAHSRKYAHAVSQFEPYNRIQQPNPGARSALTALMERAQAKKHLAFLFVNNRLEGNAPGTIEAVTGA